MVFYFSTLGFYLCLIQIIQSCHHHPEIYGGLSEAAAAAQLKAFFEQRR